MNGDSSQPPAEPGWGLPSKEQRRCSPASQFRNWETFPVYRGMLAAAVLGVTQVKMEGGRERGMHPMHLSKASAMGRANPKGSRQKACALRLGSPLLPGSFLDGFLPF